MYRFMEVEEKGGGKLFLHCKGWTGHLMFALIKVNKLILTFYSTLNLCSHDRGNFWFRLECFPLALAFAFILSLLFAALCSFTFGFES